MVSLSSLWPGTEEGIEAAVLSAPHAYLAHPRLSEATLRSLLQDGDDLVPIQIPTAVICRSVSFGYQPLYLF